MTLSSVDFPQPDGPSRQTNSPGATSRSMFSSARRSGPKRLLTPRRRTAGSGMFQPVAPAQEPIVEARHPGVDGEAEQADRDHAGHDLVGPEVLAGLEDPVAEPVVDRDHLGDDHAD